MSLTRELRRTRPWGAVPALSVGILSVWVGTLQPAVGALLVALVAGAAIANSPLAGSRLLADHAASTRFLLRLGVVMLGLKLPLSAFAHIGAGGLAVVVSTVAVTFVTTRWLGRRLGLDDGLVTLVAAGFSICGAAAIAAIDDAVRARQRDVALAVALVTVYGSAMIVLLPWTAGLIGLSEHRAALWAGASIHEVAQVVAAASIIGAGAVASATLVKLGRIMLLAPVYIVVARGDGADRQGHRVPLVPWFVTGFAVAVAVRSLGALPSVVLDGAEVATTVLLAAGMFGLGLGIRARELGPVPLRALVLATASTLIAAGTSLVLILVFT